MKKLLFFLVLVLVTMLTYAQSDSSKLSRSGVISFSKSTFFKKGRYFIGDAYASPREVHNLLANYQPSAAEFNQAKHFSKLTYYAAGTSVACIIASGIINNSFGDFRKTSAKIVFGVGIGFIIPEFVFAHKRDRHNTRSVDIYNRQFQ